VSSDPAPVRETVSACIITKDEEERLPAALASVMFCDEIVVVDSGSSDRTCEIAAAAGARVIHNDWPGFSAQRNVALDHATSEWVLEVDADERLTETLQREIQAFLAMPPPSDVAMATMPLRENLLGRPLGPSVKYPTYKNRLFRRSEYRHDEARTVHEGLWAKGRVWVLSGDLEHTLAATWKEAIEDAWNYARLQSAQVANPKGARDHFFKIVVRPTLKWVYRLTIEGGWRDGWRGWAKVSLDCLSDVVVASRRLLGTGPAPPDANPGDGAATERRLGQPQPGHRPVRIVAVAGGRELSEAALAWLVRAREAGAEVGLITDATPDPDPEVQVQQIPSMTPLRVIRALDYENQVRSVDALLLVDGLSRRLVRMAPGVLKGLAGPFELADDPAQAERVVRAASRR
jgi:hypothetical protein